MKSTGATADTLAERLIGRATALRFPSRRPRVSQLRALRDGLYRKGATQSAIPVAQEIARRDPGRESFLKLGVLYNEAGRYRKALKVFRDALRFQDGPKYLVTEIHVHTAGAWKGLGQWKRMSGALRRAYASRYKPRNVASLHMALGNYYLGSRKFQAAAEEFEKAEKACRERMGRARAAANRGFACLRAGDLNAAARHLDRAISLQRKQGKGSESGVSRMMRAAVHLDLGHLQQAFSMMSRAARDFRAAGKQDREAEALWNAGYVATELGNWARNRAYQDRAVRLASESGNWKTLVPAYALRGTSCAYLEEFEGASADLARAQMLLRGKRYWLGTLHVYRAQARIAELFGNWIRVSRLSRSAERLASKVGDTPRVVEFRRMRARAEEQLGRNRAALYARKGAARLEGLLVNGSARMRQFSKLVKKLAPTNLHVLVVGNDGTGRSEVAQEIHRLSRRSRKTCVVVPCEQLKFPEAELQGHAPGAWSGASRGSAGYVGRAEGGTLVFDHVDEMSTSDQRILVRILDGLVRPVGEPHERPVDIRVVATCKNPNRLIAEVRRRLETTVLNVPSLRERSDEIPGMVRTLLDGRRQITRDAVATLCDHDWEGNLPELRGVVERLVRATKGFIGRKAVLAGLRTSDSCRDRSLVNKKRRLRQMAAALA